MRISDWSSDVCSSDLAHQDRRGEEIFDPMFADERDDEHRDRGGRRRDHPGPPAGEGNDDRDRDRGIEADARRSEEHTSELQSLMRSSYAVFCLKKKKKTTAYVKRESRKQ